MTAQLFVRNPDGTIEGELDLFTQLDCINRFKLPGSWSIRCPVTDLALTLTEPGHGLVVIRDDKTLTSGPFWQVQRDWSDDGETLIISGYTDDVLLWDRQAWPGWPETETGATFFSQVSYDRRFGQAETVMKEYVERNLVVRADVEGAQVVTIADDLARGAYVKETARFETLGDLLSSIAVHGGGLGFSIRSDFVDSETAPLVFDVYEPADRRSEAVFSVETGNLVSFTHKLNAPTATRVIVAGQGEGRQRQFVIAEDNDAAERWGRRIEVFVDQRQTDDTDEMQQKADEVLFDKAEKSELSFRPIDVPNRTWGVDYDLGDLVTAENIEGTIAEVAYTFDADGETVVPALGSTATVSARMLARLFDATRSQRKRLELLERSV